MSPGLAGEEGGGGGSDDGVFVDDRTVDESPTVSMGRAGMTRTARRVMELNAKAAPLANTGSGVPEYESQEDKDNRNGVVPGHGVAWLGCNEILDNKDVGIASGTRGWLLADNLIMAATKRRIAVCLLLRNGMRWRPISEEGLV